MIKKFSEKFNEGKTKLKESKPSDNVILPDTDADRPMNPNTPKETVKKEKPADTSKMKPAKAETDAKETKVDEKKIDFYGKVAKFPKQTKASKAYAHLENVKISKNSIWYMLIEKQDNELQMVKYNYKKGVDLQKFVSELKDFYLTKVSDEKIREAISNIEVDGNDKFSIIKNISKVQIEGKSLITKITEDLIKLLSK